MPAVALAASLTGVLQLTSLLISPLVGYFASSSPHLYLFISSILGFASFLGFALLPGGSPEGVMIWFLVAAMGASQISGIVIGLSLVAEGRARLMGREGAREVGGAISSVYAGMGGASFFYY